MNDQRINFCFLNNYPSISEGIFSLLKISKSKLKSSGLKKNFLDKEVRAKDEVSLPVNLINDGLIQGGYIGLPVKVIYEDENLIALSKPVKVHSHPLTYNEHDNILSFLSDYNNKILNINSESYDRGLLYRLDFETSGLIYYIKDEELYHSLRSNFNQLVKKKTYLAYVVGKIDKKGTQTNKLKNSGVKGSRVVEDFSGKECTIEYERLDYEKDKNISLVKINLFEGFKHQIRVQLSLMGHSIIGDPIYGEILSSRMYLHCFQYEFEIGNKSYALIDSDFNYT